LYTQCPECQIAFRVTALVLQQAGGRVRCGGCSHAFSALDHLSEAMPEPTGDHIEIAPRGDFADDAAVDELPDDDKLAETSRRLLETLDELAGPSDVRIEDTGVEWRVLDDVVDGEGRSTPPESEEDSSAQEILEFDDEPELVAMERRYDDNTPLGEEFDENSGEFSPPPDTPKRRAEDKQDQDTSDFDAAQEDLALSEPGDWTGLLDDDSAADEIPLEVEEELAAIHDQLSSREAKTQAEAASEITPVEFNQPVELDKQFEMQAEAMGLDITGAHDISEDALTDEIPLLDDDYEEPAEDETEEEDSAKVEQIARDESAPEEAAEPGITSKDTLDEDTGSDEEFRRARAESTGEFEAKIDFAARALADGEIGEWSDADAKSHGDAEEDEEQDDSTEEDDSAGDEVAADEEKAEEDEAHELSAEDEALIRSIEADDEASDGDEADADVVTEHLVPPPTEAEMTVNMEIDAELMAAAAADEQSEESSVADAFGAEIASKMFDENSAEVETIIMEGEFVRSAIDKERLAAENDARSQIDEYGKLADTYALNRDNLRGGRRRYDPSSYTTIAGVVVLALVLIGQVMHGTRDSLATYGFFNQTMGPVYRMLGSPITPQWDIKGWQFESTTGSTDENEAVLTVFSRLVNKSELPLPFPLVHVSLTDRWEEVIGSRVLEPNEYLAGDLDPSKPVTPGETFTAVITIASPSEDATGFKLDVCYRVSPGRVRCANEDFKK